MAPACVGTTQKKKSSPTYTQHPITLPCLKHATIAYMHPSEQIDPTLSNVENAKRLGVSETTIRRWKKKQAPFNNIPPAIVTSRGTSLRLPDGSWEKITYRPQDLAAHKYQETAFEDIRRQIESWPTQPQPQPQPPTTTPTLVISLADFQIGKTDYLGGTPELLARVQDVFNQIEHTLTTNPNPQPYNEIVLVDNGDVLEGFSNTIQQQQTNDLSLTDQLRTAQAVILDALVRFQKYTPKLTYVAVPSNHCQVRASASNKAIANAPNDDFGLLVQENLEPHFPDITFIRPSKWEESVTHTTQDGTVLGVTHGHLAPNADKVGEWFAKQAFGRRSNLQNADILLHGHFHAFRISLTGDNRFVVCAPTMDSGSSWYTNKQGSSTLPAMLTFETYDHRPSNWWLYYPTLTQPNPNYML